MEVVKSSIIEPTMMKVEILLGSNNGITEEKHKMKY